jgi:hypothetical protein
VYFISKTKIDNFAKIFKVKNTFNLSTNSFNPSVSCYFAGAFVRLTGSGMDVPIGQNALGIISHQQSKSYYSLLERNMIKAK